MTIEFYDVSIREKVQIPKANVKKVIITTKNNQTRYAYKGTTSDGRTVMKFASKADWDAMDVPVGE